MNLRPGASLPRAGPIHGSLCQRPGPAFSNSLIGDKTGLKGWAPGRKLTGTCPAPRDQLRQQFLGQPPRRISASPRANKSSLIGFNLINKVDDRSTNNLAARYIAGWANGDKRWTFPNRTLRKRYPKILKPL